MKRFLITTPLEETWKRDEPILFLGDWCLIYPQQTSQLGLNAVTMPYHWNDRGKLFEDYKYVWSSYEIVLEKLSRKLNEIHEVDHSSRYWRVLVGPWLGLFMLMLFDRWRSVHQAVNSYDLSGSIVLAGLEERFTPNDANEFNSFFPNDEWNHFVYGKLLEQFPSLQLDRKPRSASVSLKHFSPPPSVKARIKKLLTHAVARTGQLFASEDDVLFLLTSLTRREEIDLSVRLRQFPQLWRPQVAVKVPMDDAKRRWSLEGKGEPETEFETCLRTLLPQQIPTVYLEGYRQLVNQAQMLPWPKRPKAIWTSNVNSDDVFKVWAAEKVERGTPLIVGQHGGNYGMGLWNWQEEHEIAIGDRYLTWGWSSSSIPKVRPVGKIKYSRPIKHLHDEGSALLVTSMVQRYGNPTLAMHTSSQWLDYLQDQFNFVDALPIYIQDKLIVRLSQPDYGWHQVDRWHDRFPMIKIDDGSSDIRKLIKKSRLYISTYNATTYLESLSMNVPTVIYWNPKYMETNKRAQPYFDELQRVGVFHNTPLSAARHVAQIWDKITPWWTSPQTHVVRDRFSRQFAYCPKDKIGRLRDAIREAIN